MAQRCRFVLSLVAVAALCGLLIGQTFAAEWREYTADKGGSKYLPLNQINKDNVNDLVVAWTWGSPDEAILEGNRELHAWVNQLTPIVVDGVMYVNTLLSQAAAIDAATGETLWVYDPGTYRDGTPATVGFVQRGVSYWEDGDDKRIILGTGDAYIVALDAATGEPIETFGDGGRIDATKGLRRPVDRAQYAIQWPPMICGDRIITGSGVLDSFAVGRPPAKVMPPGDVRGFDVRTGEQRWVFHQPPQKGEFGYTTWENDSWKITGNANAWAKLSCDEELDYVFVPFSTPTNDYYGGHRLGDNLFAESLVAMRASTGERVWHFQMVHHGLWDYDLPTNPNLLDITVDGRTVKAAAQVTKQGFVYVFDRETGEPIWPIEERAVPQSTIPGERSSPTQPFPSKPAPFAWQGVTEDDVISFTPELKAEALDILDQYDYGPLFEPPTMRGTILMPGLEGGASWSGAAHNPDTGVLYVPTNLNPYVVKIVESNSAHEYIGTLINLRYGGPQGLPLFKPPYSEVVAIDLNTGEHLWRTTVGDGPRDHPALEGLDLPQLGWPRRCMVMLTESLLFVAQQGDMHFRGFSPRRNALEVDAENKDAYLWAYDPETGEQVAEIPLPGNAFGSPMTFEVNGKQHIVLPLGGAGLPAELISLTIPDSKPEG